MLHDSPEGNFHKKSQQKGEERDRNVETAEQQDVIFQNNRLSDQVQHEVLDERREDGTDQRIQETVEEDKRLEEK